jgi:C4-type Zn-finger protein
MTFTYTPSTSPDNITLIRFHIQDVVAAYPIYSDEEIEMMLAVESSVGKTVVTLIEGIIQKLAQEPDVTADWLTISWRRSADQWEKMLADKKKKFGVGMFTVTTTAVDMYRKDSLQGYPPDSTETYEPNYHDGRSTDYRDDEGDGNYPLPYNIDPDA